MYHRARQFGSEGRFLPCGPPKFKTAVVDFASVKLPAGIVTPSETNRLRCSAQFRRWTRSISFEDNSRATRTKRESHGIPPSKRSLLCALKFNPSGGRECHS